MIFAKNFARNYLKNDIWKIRRLVDESFVPANQPTSVLYCRLSDINSTSESTVLCTQTTIASGKAAWAGRQASYDYYKCSFLQV